MSGKDVTPFVLQRVNQLTNGKSLEASILNCFNSMLETFHSTMFNIANEMD